jgi:hypothetical protein
MLLLVTLVGRADCPIVAHHYAADPAGGEFNERASERQLEILREMGCNAIRMAPNPSAPELLELTDKRGVTGEIKLTAQADGFNGETTTINAVR